MANAAPHGSVVPRWQRRLSPGRCSPRERTGDESGPAHHAGRCSTGFSISRRSCSRSRWHWRSAVDVVPARDGNRRARRRLRHPGVPRSVGETLEPWGVGVAVISVSAFSASRWRSAGLGLYGRRAVLSAAGRWITALSLAASAVTRPRRQTRVVQLRKPAGRSAVYRRDDRWGLFARARRELVVSLNDRARRVEATQRDRVEQADAPNARRSRDARRARHRLSLLKRARRRSGVRPDAPPEEIERAAAVIRDSADAALEESARGDRPATRDRRRSR